MNVRLLRLSAVVSLLLLASVVALGAAGVEAIANGGFEEGPDGSWEEYSLHGWPVIVSEQQLLAAPHGGTWAAWLGGDANEQSAITQGVMIPSGPSTLHYWNRIDSEDSCGYDMAGVVIDGVFEQVFYLCVENSTEGWVLREVDLSAYAGKTVLLTFFAETDSSLNSNFFVDDVSIKEGPVATPEPTVQPGPEVKNGAYLPVLFNG
jgi:aminopeptidase S